MTYTNASKDVELIQGCIAKHRLAQKYLYQRYYGQMLGVTMRYTQNRDEANEILNRAFLRVFKYVHKYKDQGNLKGWISKIVLNTALDHVRKSANYKSRINYNAVADETVMNDAIEHLEIEEMYKLIQNLKPQTQAVFSLYTIDGFKHREIAEKLSISEGTSKWHLSMAKKELKALIKKVYNLSLIA